MLYGKLPIVFLSTIASEKQYSTNSVIAQYILDNLDAMRNIGIKEMAENCNVRPSSISRFCREIGLSDFQELKELLHSTTFSYKGYSEESASADQMYKLNEKIKSSLDLVTQSIFLEKTIQLAQDIQTYPKVATFGMMKAETASIILQSDLLMLGKQIYTNTSYAEQIQYIENADQNTLIIIFTYTGAYFEYEEKNRQFLKKGRSPKIWVVTGNQKKFPFYISEILHFSSLQDHTSHPYQLDLAASFIGQAYANLIKSESKTIE